MAKETNCPIIPFVIVGKYRPFINNLKVIYSEPMDVTNLSYEEGIDSSARISIINGLAIITIFVFIK